METRSAKRRRIAGATQHKEEQQQEEGKAKEKEQALVPLPAANWHRRRDLLEDCLVGTGAGRLPRDLVGIVDGYCGEEFEGTSEELTAHTGFVLSVCALGDGRLASGSGDRTIRIWDLNKGGECVQTLTGHTSSIFSVCALGDGRLASGSGDNTIRT